MRRAPTLTQTLPLLLLALGAPPALAKDALGIFATWAAFRDPADPRCYAIAMPVSGPEPGPESGPASGPVSGPKSGPQASPAPSQYQPYAAIGIWPRRGIHGALHLRLSHRLAPGTAITLSLGGGSQGSHRYALVGGGGDAWPATPRDDAAITAALRSASTLSVTARDTTGHPFTDTYPLAGAATAIDAAAIGCASFR